MRASTVALLVGLAGISADAQLEKPILPMRDWTSSDGRQIRAELLGREQGSVRLRLEGGKRALVPVERLAAADRAELVRLRLSSEYQFDEGEAAHSRYYHSRKAPAGANHQGIAGMISVGPGRFLFELKVHSIAVDLRKYSRLRLQAPGFDHPHGYAADQVASWKSGPGETTRVVVQIPPDDSARILPVLSAGLAEGASLSVKAESDAAGTVELAMSDVEREALRDLLSVFLEAAPLVVDGTIRKEPLEDQVFAAAAAVPAAPSPNPADPSAATDFDLLPEEAEVLERLRTARGGGRLGQIRWSPSQGGPQDAGGLGWLRNRVVLRTSEGHLRMAPFDEIDKEARKRALNQRLREFSGTRPTEGRVGELHYPEGWTEHKRENHQGLVFGRTPSGEPFLLIQALSNRLAGKPISGIGIRGDGGTGFVSVEIDAASNRTRPNAADWSIAVKKVDETPARQLAALGTSRALDIQISSATESSTFPLTGDHLLVSLEALRCYEWALLIGSTP